MKPPTYYHDQTSYDNAEPDEGDCCRPTNPCAKCRRIANQEREEDPNG
jgi:hypothetical protein